MGNSDWVLNLDFLIRYSCLLWLRAFRFLVANWKRKEVGGEMAEGVWIKCAQYRHNYMHAFPLKYFSFGSIVGKDPPHRRLSLFYAPVVVDQNSTSFSCGNLPPTDIMHVLMFFLDKYHACSNVVTNIKCFYYRKMQLNCCAIIVARYW